MYTSGQTLPFPTHQPPSLLNPPHTHTDRHTHFNMPSGIMCLVALLCVMLCHVVGVNSMAITDGLWAMGWPSSDSFSLMYFDPSKGDFVSAVSTNLALSFPGTCFIYVPSDQRFHGTVELQDTKTLYVKFNPADSTWESIKPEYNLATCEHDPESATTYVTWFGVTDTQPPMYAVRFGTMNTTSGQVTHLKDFPQLYQNYTSLGKSAYDIKNKIYYTLLGSDVFGRSIAAINVKTLDVSVSPVCPQCAIQDLKVSQSDQSLIVTRMSPEKYNNVTGNFTYDIVSWSIQGGLGKRVGYLYETFPSNGTGFYNGFHNTGYDWVNKKYYANLGPYLLEASINPGSPNGPAKPFPITAGVNNMRYVSMTDFTTDPDDNAIIVHRLRGGLRERRGEWAADQRGAGRIRVKTDGPVTTIEAVVPK
eukprot:TRINITY_DN4151_c1_g2_i4.p1 TRINITY_DN4151_c1_g2~~TRINITY_DN4151_c1_g2_i4.p1  ORF type:complete len:419 (+),score=54.96 TRINITY_DN4151_c1_g2_i4:170-1426(+)